MLRKASSLCVAMVLFAVLGLTLAGCKKSEDQAASNTAGSTGGATTAPAKTIKVGTEATFPPFESRSAAGEFEGYDIDMLREIGRRAGFNVEFVDMKFDSLILALQNGQIDMIASGFSITDERKKQVDYSDPYIEAGLVMAVRKNDTSIKSSADLKGKVAAVQQGSTGANKADELKKEGVLKDVRYFPTAILALMELAKGGADVVINDKPVSEVVVAKMSDQVKLLDEVLVSDSYGLAFRKGNTDLLNKVNEAMRAMKQDGYFDKLNKQHFAAAPEAATPATQPATAPAGE